MKKLFKVLDFLRIIDDGHRLSLTNLVMFVCIYKTLVAPQFSITEVTALLVAMTSYGYKKHLNKAKADITDENKKAIADMSTKVQQIADKTSGLSAAMGVRNPLQK